MTTYTGVDFDKLLGKTFTAVTVSDDKDIINFVTIDGERYEQFHSQDCCEEVRVEDVVGDLSDLVGSPILQAEEVVSKGGDPVPDVADNWTWSFYKLATIKGSVTIRWLGQSNGYYSETVDLYRLEDSDD